MPIVPIYGHAAVRARLIAAFRRGALPASLLFHGPRGVGKQRLALWLGQALVCTGTSGTNGEPCGTCQGCRFALVNGHPDIHWFFPRPRPRDADLSTDEVLGDYADAVAERVKAGGLYAAPGGMEGIFVSTVTAITQIASRSPALGHRKVFIIGDADRMVAQEGADAAANALLKLLEEPPANTQIILTSSEAGALLPTIRSRVVGVRVAALPRADVEAFLGDQRVAEAVRAVHGSTPTSELLRIADGAPGRLFGSEERAAAVAGAQRMLDSALAGDRSKTVRVAMAQGSAKARGAFSDALDELTALLAARARAAVARGDDRAALGATRAIASVEGAKEMAAGNVNPALIAATLLRTLSRELA